MAGSKTSYNKVEAVAMGPAGDAYHLSVVRGLCLMCGELIAIVWRSLVDLEEEEGGSVSHSGQPISAH